MVSRRGLAVAFTALTMSACGASAHHAARSTGPHPVSADQADRLAVTRFLNYQGTGARFATTLASPQGTLAVAGYIDWRAAVGYAAVTGTSAGFVLEWNARRLLAWPVAHPGRFPSATLPAGTPRVRALAPSSTDVDALCAVLLSLGQDRPDNAQLITQGGARWLRRSSLGGTPVDVISGPRGSGAAVATYWIDARGHLLRLDAAFGGSGSAAISFDRSAFRAIPRSPRLTA